MEVNAGGEGSGVESFAPATPSCPWKLLTCCTIATSPMNVHTYVHTYISYANRGAIADGDEYSVCSFFLGNEQ